MGFEYGRIDGGGLDQDGRFDIDMVRLNEVLDDW